MGGVLGVLVGGAPFLGICVGMQLLASRGVEHGITQGLGWIPGEVRLIEVTDPAIKIPHMGWNDLILPRPSVLLEGLDGEDVYFAHSFAVDPTDERVVVAAADHDGRVVAVARERFLDLHLFAGMLLLFVGVRAAFRSPAAESPSE